MILLTKRVYSTNGDKEEPRRQLLKYKTVVECEYSDKTSDAGDWSGYLIQQIKSKYYLIPFFQQRKQHPDHGYRYSTGSAIARFDSMPDCDEVLFILKELDYHLHY